MKQSITRNKVGSTVGDDDFSCSSSSSASAISSKGMFGLSTHSPGSIGTSGSTDDSLIEDELPWSQYFEIFFSNKHGELKAQIYEFFEYFELPYAALGLAVSCTIFIGTPFTVLFALDLHSQDDADGDLDNYQRHRSQKMIVELLLIINCILAIIFGAFAYKIRRAKANLQQIKSTTFSVRIAGSQKTTIKSDIAPIAAEDGTIRGESEGETDIEKGHSDRESNKNANVRSQKHQKNKNQSKSPSQYWEERWEDFITISHKLLMQTLIVLAAIRKSYGGICFHEDSNDTIRFLKIYFCESSPQLTRSGLQYRPGLDSDVFILLMMHPLAQTVLYPGTPLTLTLFQSLISLATYIGILTFHGEYPAITVLMMWFILSIVFPMIQHHRNIYLFLMTKKLRKMAELDAKEQQENHLNEMRFVIANVAHDLKTPLTSFTSGVEFIKEVIHEGEDKLCRQLQQSQQSQQQKMQTPQDALIVSENTIELLNQFKIMKESLQTIIDTNSFMLMTINRCIDYAKASKGIKLLPKLETIDLWETMDLPLTCMRSVQDRVRIVLLNDSGNNSQSTKLRKESICSHVITDKQWLQENLLCLLSNAVKYTSEGDVTISVTLEYRGSRKQDVPQSCEHVTDEANPQRNKLEHQGSSTAPTPFGLGGGSNSSFLRNSLRANSSLRGYEGSFFQTLQKSIRGITGGGGNSTKVTPTPNIAPIKPSPPPLFLRFEVEDTGIGVPIEMQKKLFRPFKQTQRLAGGTGLGLYSLAKRIEAIHGKYGVRSRKDGLKGSVFWFSIPYRPDEVTASMMAQMTEISTDHSFIATGSTTASHQVQSAAAAVAAKFFALPSTQEDENDDLDCGSAFHSLRYTNPPTTRRSMMISREDTSNHASFRSSSNTNTSLSFSDEIMKSISESLSRSFVNIQPSMGNVDKSKVGVQKGPKEETSLNARNIAASAKLFVTDFISEKISSKSFRAATTQSQQAKDDQRILSSFSATQSIRKVEGTSSVDAHENKDQAEIVLSPQNATVPITKPRQLHDPLNILLVDDSMAILKMVSMVLRKSSHTVTTADNGMNAIKAVESHWRSQSMIFDVILMDLQMPILDGIEATKRLRAMEKRNTDASTSIVLPKQIIIGFSANSDLETSQAAFTAGIDAFMTKPFKMETFTKIVGDLMVKLIPQDV